MEIYGLDVSEATISRITDKVVPLIQEWKSRPLEAIYLFVWLDAIHYKVRHEGRVISRAVYCVLGINQASVKMNVIFAQKSKIVIFLFVPLAAINNFFLFKKEKLNLSEHSIIAGIILLGMLLISAL
jgi:hypothetical protein